MVSYTMSEIAKKVVKLFAFTVLLFLLLSEIVIGGIKLVYLHKNYPRVVVANTPVGNLTQPETQNLLSQRFVIPEKIYLEYNGQIIDLSTADFNLKYDPVQTSHSALAVGRKANFFQNISDLFVSVSIPLSYQFDQQLLSEQIVRLEKSLGLSPREATIVVNRGKIVIQNGTDGLEINQAELINQLSIMLENGHLTTIKANTLSVSNKLTPQELEVAQKRGTTLIGKNALFYVDDVEVKLTDSDLVALIDPAGGLNQTTLIQTVKQIAQEVNREPQNPIFVMENDKVSEFAPSKDGLTVDEKKLATIVADIEQKLENNLLTTYSTAIPVERTFSEYNTGDVNNLGIKELIGKGNSDFKGSIASRIHNVGLSASKFQGIIVKPGETMSFNKILGDVSALTGYQQAYIIKDGATILGDGGGVCQVSSTMFRAALNAGLPILERQAHAYRVYYYEQNSQPGLDATVYDPSPDLKIKNNTAYHVLIQTKMDAKKLHLTIEIYGTNDGRKATISKSTISDRTDPLPDIYVDDPTLPTGVVKQIDHQAAGAKITFDYQVEKDGQVIYQKKFISVYQPWANKFLRGTGLAN